MKYLFTATILCFLINNSYSQKQITVEDIWQNSTFSTKGVPGFNFLNDGTSYARLEMNDINVYDLKSGEKTKRLIEGKALKLKGIESPISNYSLSNDENKVLIQTDVERIYRHSTKAKYYIYDIDKTSLDLVFEGKKVRNATFSPDGNKIAFVYENNLYYSDLTDNSTFQVTKDGIKNQIINGVADWVYEEEFAFTRAFFWSPDSRRVAFMKFDEGRVPQFTMMMYRDDVYPHHEVFKYPKVGEDNAIVSAHIFDTKKKRTVHVELGDMSEMYIPRIKWTEENDQLCVFKMNRHQNHLQLLLANADSGNTKLLLEEKNKYYIDITDDLTFLGDKKHFIWTSEKNGFNQIFLYNMDGEEIINLTNGEYDVTSFYGLDEKEGKLYYQSAEISPLQRQVYEIDIDGSDKKVLTQKKGTNRAIFSGDYSHFVNIHSDLNSPNSYEVLDNNGNRIRTIVENSHIADIQKDYNLNPLNFFNFTTSEGVKLNGWMIKPSNFDDSKEYPVFMYLYGGPGSQTVTDSWKGSNYWWFQMLAQQGYIVVSIDNRGTGARGEEFKKMTYMKLGHFETIDQIEAAKYLGGLSYIDENRIGIFGWSYGGYMSSLCLFKGHEVFKMAIAVAPVTNWKWYDTVYTERYMRTYVENPEGYDDNSPIHFADSLKGKYLLIHGMGDDNVHFQNSVELTNALIKANKQFDYYAYPNRNHGIYGGNTRLHLYTKMTDFIKENL